MENSLSQFFKEHSISEVLPDNAKIVVLNHETSIAQCINAMVIEQNVQWAAVWDSEKKDFLGIITLRDLLEMIVFFTESLKDSLQKEEVASMNEKPFLYYFFDRYLAITNPLFSQSIPLRPLNKPLKRVDSGLAMRSDLSILPKILDQIALYEWFAVSKDIIKFQKSQLKEFNIDDSIFSCLQYMNENGFNFLSMLNQERSQLQGFINFNEIMKFLVENYTGDISFFEKPLVKVDLTQHNLFPSYQKLVIARDSDSLFSVLKKMSANRISCIPIERQINPNDQHTTRTVGLAFLTDLLFLLRLPNYYKYLDEPIINFVSDLNGLEEDASYFDQISTAQASLGNSSNSHKTTDLQKLNSNIEEKKTSGQQKKSSAHKSNRIDEELNCQEDGDGEGDDEDEEEKEQPFIFFQQPKDGGQSNGQKDFDDLVAEEGKCDQDPNDELEFQRTSTKLQQIATDHELQIEDLFGKVYGIERVLLLKKSDTLKDVIEKITLIPESKLMYVDIEQGYPKIKNLLSLSDLFSYIAANNYTL